MCGRGTCSSAIDSTSNLHIKIPRYLDVLPKFGKAYNDTGHSSTGMALSRVTHGDEFSLFLNGKMCALRGRILRHGPRKDFYYGL